MVLPPVFFSSLLQLACASLPEPLRGVHRVEGEGVRGEVRAPSAWGLPGDAPRIELHGPGFTTGPAVAARVLVEEDGRVWLEFPLQTALGEATASLRVQGADASLPLGGRPGEFDLDLQWTEGADEPGALAAAAALSAGAVEQARVDWGRGAFRLETPATPPQLVGELQFRGDEPPRVAVYDRWWWTGGVVVADQSADGPDILLAFAVEPSVQGEEGLLRVNVPAMTAVVPADRLPTDLDRRLRLVPGPVGEEERRLAMAAAVAEADRLEREAIEPIARQLATRALQPDGSCLGWRDLAPGLEPQFVGYEVQVLPSGEACAVSVETTRPQHRRRLRTRVESRGKDKARAEEG